MASVATGGAVRAGFRPSFHLWMVLAMCFFIFGGFGLTYLGPMAAGTRPPDPPVVHLHGVVFFAWMVLLVAQSVLITIISAVDSRVEVWNGQDYRLFYLSFVAQ